MLSGLIITGLLKTIDSKAIASTRRISGLVFASNLIWLVPVLIGFISSSILHGAPMREFVFGAFLAWGFEFIIINGAFLRSALSSFIIAAVHPVPILLLITYGSINQYLFPGFLGLIVLMISAGFLLRINSIKTRNGMHSLEVLRAFLKTWVEREPTELEGYFEKYSKNDSVITTIFMGQAGEKRLALVLPGIHPGPFSPVGSYNLSELLYQQLKDRNLVPVILHGVGGHERNVPRNEIANDYAMDVSKFAMNLKPKGEPQMRGPIKSRVGITNITTLSFGTEIMAVVSNAPYRSDDLDPDTITAALDAASELGLGINVVDAHNSVDGENVPQEQITKAGWKQILSQTIQLRENDFRLGFANSNEIGFKSQSDISDGGISVTIFATKDTKSVLVAADSNNSTFKLRERVENEVMAMGMQLIDLCTSDTHKLAARNMASRGYFALGEQSDSQGIVDCVKKLVVMADGRLTSCTIEVARLRSTIPLIGKESLDDFAALTTDSIKTARKSTVLILPALLLLLGITLFY
jgi:putative membrane protein